METIFQEIDIRGEVFINNFEFENSKINLQTRNAASGSLRQKDPMETKKFH